MVGGGRALCSDGQAQAVLPGANASIGPADLLNGLLLDGFCGERLADLPCEASLIKVAGEGDPAGVLKQQSSVGADAAVRLTASSLAQSLSLDPPAGMWASAAFARAVGCEVSDSLSRPGTGEGACGVPLLGSEPLVAGQVRNGADAAAAAPEPAEHTWEASTIVQGTPEAASLPERRVAGSAKQVVVEVWIRGER